MTLKEQILDELSCAFQEGLDYEDFMILINKALDRQMEEVNRRIGFLRQYLNERPDITKLVTNEELEHWLIK